MESNADAVYVIGQGGNRTMVRSSTRQAERDFHWCLTLCIAIKRRANWLTAKLSAKLLVSAIVRGEAYELRVGCQEATDVPGVFGQGRASGEGEPDPRSSLPLPFGRPHRTTGAHHGARPASEGGSGADHQTAGGAGHVFSHGSGGSTSGTPRSLYPDPRPAAVAPHEGDDSGLLRVEESSFASCILRLLSGYGLHRRRGLRRSHTGSFRCVKSPLRRAVAFRLCFSSGVGHATPRSRSSRESRVGPRSAP